jgi:cytoskeleton protein RodZ
MTADPAPSNLGAKLHQARASRGVSLREIADATKISIGILQALECNDISRLPGGVFGRGFVRSFATEVGLDPEASVAEFVAQFPTDSVTVGYPTSERSEENEVVETRRSGAPILLALVLFAAFLVYFVTRERTRNHAVVQSTPAAATAEAAPSDSATRPTMVRAPAPAEVPAGSPAAAVASTENSAPPAPTLAFAPQSVPASGAPESAPALSAPESVPANAGSTVPTKTEEKPGTEKPATEKPALEPMSHHIFVVLAVTRASWVIATVDGKKTVNRLLQVGEQETLETGRDLVLTVGDAGAIVMTVNGAAARSLGRPGEAVTAYVNRTNLKKYLAPR